MNRPEGIFLLPVIVPSQVPFSPSRFMTKRSTGLPIPGSILRVLSNNSGVLK